jgi:hypothetical protein
VRQLCSNSVSLACIRPRKEEIVNNFNWSEVLHARTSDNPDVTIVPNIKLKMNARHSIHYLSLNDLLEKPLDLPLPLSISTQRTP